MPPREHRKPELLYASPVIPSLTGNGLAMRSGMVLEALAANFSISLLVFELYASPQREVPPELARFCRRITILKPRPPRRFCAPLWGLGSRWFGRLAPYHRLAFDVVHVFRLATLSRVRPLLATQSARPQLHLDLDDIESATHARLAALCRSNGDWPRAVFEELEVRRFKSAEEEAFREADRIYVCSERDKALLESRCPAAIRVLPNAVRFPPSPPPAPTSGASRFLFIGTLGYYPNQDAAIYLCREIVPRVRRLSPVPVAFEIAGGGASQELRKIAGDSGVDLAGPVPSVAACYEAAVAAVVPLRAGGGTRIKILEAFSYRRPVVSTPLGAEGLAVRDGQDILLAEGPDAFAQACVRLATSRTLRDSLARNAFELALRSYSLEALRRQMLESS